MDHLQQAVSCRILSLVAQVTVPMSGLVVGCMLVFPAPPLTDRRGYQVMGTLNVGEWVEGGETVTYDPCPPGLADGN